MNVKISSNVISRQNPDGTVALLHLDNDEFFYSLDGIAAEFWVLLEKDKDLSKILSKLESRYSQNKKELTKDIQSLLKNLKKNQLIKSKS